jgi:hypothetical protein
MAVRGVHISHTVPESSQYEGPFAAKYETRKRGLRAILPWRYGFPVLCSEERKMLFQSRCLIVAIALSAASCSAASLQQGSAAARDPNVLGATGQAVVIGSGSSMAGSDRVHPDWGSAAVSSFDRD